MVRTKELRPSQDDVSCDVCGRTILKGERTHSYLTRERELRRVCDLCAPRAQRDGWIRAEDAASLPDDPVREEPRFRIRRRGAGGLEGGEGEPPPGPDAPRGAPIPEDAPIGAPGSRRGRRQRSIPPVARLTRGLREPRHVRAIPTAPEGKVARAVELFNGSPYTRTVAGVSRSLGAPLVSAHPVAETPSEVNVTVAWDLSWYRYRVDLGDNDEPVELVARGEEVAELDEGLRRWNVSAAPDGTLVLDEPPAGGDGGAAEVGSPG